MARPRVFWALATAVVAALLLTPAGAGAAAAAAAAGTAATPKPPLDPNGVGLTFSGSGFLGVFHLGVDLELQDLGLVTRRTPSAGTSGGSLVSGLNCLGVPQAAASALYSQLDDKCRGEWSCAGRLDATVKAAMRQAVTDAMAAAGVGDGASQADRDAFVRARCTNTARFTVSRVDGSLPLGQALRAAAPMFVTDFKNEDDFVDAGAASAFIPLFSGREAGVAPGQRWHTLFRGLAAVDGGFSAPLPPCAPGVATCVKIVATTAHLAPKKAGGGGMLGGGGGGGGGGGLLALLGFGGGGSGAAASSSPPAPAAKKAGQPLDDADIRPGKYSPLPMGLTYETWQQHALAAPPDAMARAMQEHGREQARLWACQAYPAQMAAAAGGAACGGGGGSGAPSSSSSGQGGKQGTQGGQAPRKMMMPLRAAVQQQRAAG